MLLRDLAHARSGDKGGTSDITVVAFDAAGYDLLCRELSADGSGSTSPTCRSRRWTATSSPQLHALKFVLHGALGGGVTQTLNLDAHGKCLSSCLLGLSMRGEHEYSHD